MTRAGTTAESSAELQLEISPAQLSRMARNLGAGLGIKERLLFRYRPYICPFHELVRHVPRGGNLLDIGCGNGLWLLLLAELDRISGGVGVEITEQKINTAKILAEKFPRLQFHYRAPAEPWPAGNCDCISLIDVLHHVPRAGQADFLRRIARTPARTIVFKDINPAHPFRRRMNTLHDVVLSQQIPNYRSMEFVIGQLQKEGFEIRHTQTMTMLWYSHYWVVASRSS